MLILNVNGPINAGKSTVCKILADMLPRVLFIEVDELLSDKEQEAKGLDFRAGIAERLDRLDKKIAEEQQGWRYDYLVFAYPMSEKNFERWQSCFVTADCRFAAVTLACDLEICLTNRGTRELSEWEKQRIKEMYQKGYQKPKGTDLIIDNSKQTPQETAAIIRDFVLSLG